VQLWLEGGRKEERGEERKRRMSIPEEKGEKREGRGRGRGCGCGGRRGRCAVCRGAIGLKVKVMVVED
jgi:hypothetical protein